MNINRNNYQEFLLLYIDGELSNEVEKEVDIFLESNNDIKQEFDDLLNTKLQIEDVSFGDITTLFKTEGNEISATNYQEHFLLFVDNELNKQQKQATETFVLQHPNLQQEFLALQQTKLSIENIVCPNKKELYKTENKSIIFYIQRMAVAAVFIGLVTFIWNINTASSTTEIANTSIPKNKNTPVILPANEQKKDAFARKNNVVTNSKVTTPKTEVVYVKNNTSKLKKNVSDGVTKAISTTLTNQNNSGQNISNNNINTIVATNQIQNNNISNNASNNNINMALASTNSIASNSPATKQIIYKSLDSDDDNKSASAIGEENKISKLKGLFKKAVNAITPKDSDDNDTKKLLAVTL